MKKLLFICITVLSFSNFGADLDCRKDFTDDGKPISKCYNADTGSHVISFQYQLENIKTGDGSSCPDSSFVEICNGERTENCTCLRKTKIAITVIRQRLD